MLLIWCTVLTESVSQKVHKSVNSYMPGPSYRQIKQVAYCLQHNLMNGVGNPSAKFMCQALLGACRGSHYLTCVNSQTLLCKQQSGSPEKTGFPSLSVKRPVELNMMNEPLYRKACQSSLYPILCRSRRTPSGELVTHKKNTAARPL